MGEIVDIAEARYRKLQRAWSAEAADRLTRTPALRRFYRRPDDEPPGPGRAA